MTNWFAMCGLAAVLAAPVLMAPGSASASCAERKATGTVVGGVGGALIGNSISHGGGGAILGGLGGAVVGHQIAKGGCADHRYTHTDRRYRSHAYRRHVGNQQAQAATYYDQRGNAVGAGPTCTTDTRTYYDERGNLVRRPVQTCSR
jgi:uncharacterized protein YcfJ